MRCIDGDIMKVVVAIFASLVLIVAVLALVAAIRPSLKSAYRREVERGLARQAADEPILVTDADLARHPHLVQTYLRRVGVVGKPHVLSVHARFAAQMKTAPDAPFMNASAEQVNLFDEPTRIFVMDASRGGVPFTALHVYRGEHATFEVRVANLLKVADARGPEMDRSETVTMFNDLCFFAAPALVDANVSWEEIDATHVRGHFTNAGITISAELTFDEHGDLVSFVSNDRSMTADGKTYEHHPWVTPVGEYREMGGYRIATKGDAIWKRPQGDFVYGRFEVTELAFNLPRATPPARVAELGTPGGVSAGTCAGY